MYRKIFIVLLLCCLCPAVCLQAQTKEEKTAQYAFSFEPAHLYNGGFRVNLEKQLRSTDWIELNLTGYYLPHKDAEVTDSYYYWGGNSYMTSNSDFDSFLGLAGLGIGITYKSFFHRNLRVYPAFSYNWYNVEYAGYDYYSYNEDGLTFYDYKWADTKQSFHKLAAHVSLGVRSSLERSFFVEPYFGMGYAYSFYDKNKRHYNETMFGFGHRGLFLTAGIKLGFNIR